MLFVWLLFLLSSWQASQSGYSVDYATQGGQSGFPGSFLNQNSQAGYGRFGSGSDFMSQVWPSCLSLSCFILLVFCSYFSFPSHRITWLMGHKVFSLKLALMSHLKKMLPRAILGWQMQTLYNHRCSIVEKNVLFKSRFTDVYLFTMEGSVSYTHLTLPTKRIV